MLNINNYKIEGKFILPISLKWSSPTLIPMVRFLKSKLNHIQNSFKKYWKFEFKYKSNTPYVPK